MLKPPQWLASWHRDNITTLLRGVHRVEHARFVRIYLSAMRREVVEVFLKEEMNVGHNADLIAGAREALTELDK